MSEDLSSTAATDGSANDFPPLPSTSSPSSSKTFAITNFTSLLATIDAAHGSSPTQSSNPSSISNTRSPLASPRMTSWINNPTGSQPQYAHASFITSVATHTRDMASYLKAFDNVMTKKSSP
ncbi:hypothetical protein BDZ45DRAFT_797802 [Acephala macrosclerotiorum]|nr:hypothetical protein BDZ45DRAFT_797802 [Acephala macrosclerotiorum]